METEIETKTEQDNIYTETVGDRRLCAWRVDRRVIWVQTRCPKMARRLGWRADGRLVAQGVAGGYLRTYEFAGKSLAWAKRLIERYSSAASPAKAPEPKSAVSTL